MRGGQIGIFGLAPDSLGPKTGKRAFLGPSPGKIELTAVIGILQMDSKTLCYSLSPKALWLFSAVSRTRFSPGAPKTGLNRIFALKTPQYYGKRKEGNLGALGSAGASLLLGGAHQK